MPIVGAILLLAAALAIPGRPGASHTLRFDGYVQLPKAGRAGLVSQLDFLTVADDSLFVAGTSGGVVYKIALRKRPVPMSSDVSEFAPGPAPHDVIVEPTSGLAFVTRSDANVVDAFDPGTMQLAQRINVAPDPDAMLFDADDGLIYVASSEGKAATIIDPARRARVAVIPLGGQGESAVQDPRSGLIYQNLADVGALVAVDVERRRVARRWPLEGCDMPTGIAEDDKARRLFIACAKSSKLLVFDLASEKVVGVVPITFGADCVAFDPQLGRIYVTGLLGRLDVIQHNGRGGYQVVETVPLHFNAHTLALDPATHHLFVGYPSLAVAPRVAVFAAKSFP